MGKVGDVDNGTFALYATFLRQFRSRPEISPDAPQIRIQAGLHFPFVCCQGGSSGQEGELLSFVFGAAVESCHEPFQIRCMILGLTTVWHGHVRIYRHEIDWKCANHCRWKNRPSSSTGQRGTTL